MDEEHTNQYIALQGENKAFVYGLMVSQSSDSNVPLNPSRRFNGKVFTPSHAYGFEMTETLLCQNPSWFVPMSPTGQEDLGLLVALAFSPEGPIWWNNEHSKMNEAPPSKVVYEGNLGLILPITNRTGLPLCGAYKLLKRLEEMDFVKTPIPEEISKYLH